MAKVHMLFCVWQIIQIQYSGYVNVFFKQSWRYEQKVLLYGHTEAGFGSPKTQIFVS